MGYTTNFREWFANFTEQTGETPSQIVFGFSEWHDYRVEEWPEINDNRMWWWDEIPASVLDRRFDAGYGSTDSPNLCAWSKSFVLFSDDYDGSEELRWLPRHPVAHQPIRAGGGG